MMNYALFDNQAAAYVRDGRKRLRKFTSRDAADKANLKIGAHPRFCVRIAPLSAEDLAVNAANVERIKNPPAKRVSRAALRRAA